MNFIGLDPGTKTGWAVLSETGERIASGTWQLENRRGDGAGMRYVRLERLFRELLDAYPGPVAYELVAAHKGTHAAHIYGGIVATITRVCEQLERPYAGIPVGTVKKCATGKGNANKDMMRDAAMERWERWLHEHTDDSAHRQALMDDNEADSLWVAEAMREGLG